MQCSAKELATKKTTTRLMLALGAAALALGGVSANAGTTYTSYNTTVGKFNGNGYTGYQNKTTSSAAGNLRSGTVGGSHVVDARMQASAGTGAWARGVNDNESRTLTNSVGTGKSARVQFSTNWNTRVDVQVTGSWRSN